jgi:hypothetical protein
MTENVAAFFTPCLTLCRVKSPGGALTYYTADRVEQWKWFSWAKGKVVKHGVLKEEHLDALMCVLSERGISLEIIDESLRKGAATKCWTSSEVVLT